MARDRIHVHELRVDCIVGVYPHERTTPQPLLIDLELGLDTSEAAYSGRIAATCDYSRVASEIETLLGFRRYRLLEMAAEEVAAMLLGVHRVIGSIRLRMSKPMALEGRARVAGVEIQRTRADFMPIRERSEFGEVEILYQTREAGLYLLHIEAGREIPAHFHERMRELEWLHAGAIERDGERLYGFAPVEWSKGRVHRYVNVGNARASLFCCDMPPFMPEDEILAARPE
ncbi:dihydroneopterin aldolase [Nannocystaceae bacterium ST9]